MALIEFARPIEKEFVWKLDDICNWWAYWRFQDTRDKIQNPTFLTRSKTMATKLRTGTAEWHFELFPNGDIIQLKFVLSSFKERNDHVYISVHIIDVKLAYPCCYLEWSKYYDETSKYYDDISKFNDGRSKYHPKTSSQQLLLLQGSSYPIQYGSVPPHRHMYENMKFSHMPLICHPKLKNEQTLDFLGSRWFEPMVHNSHGTGKDDDGCLVIKLKLTFTTYGANPQI